MNNNISENFTVWLLKWILSKRKREEVSEEKFFPNRLLFPRFEYIQLFIMFYLMSSHEVSFNYALSVVDFIVCKISSILFRLKIKLMLPPTKKLGGGSIIILSIPFAC